MYRPLNKDSRRFFYKNFFCELFYDKYRFSIGANIEYVKFTKVFNCEFNLGYHTFYMKIYVRKLGSSK